MSVSPRASTKMCLLRHNSPPFGCQQLCSCFNHSQETVGCKSTNPSNSLSLRLRNAGERHVVCVWCVCVLCVWCVCCVCACGRVGQGNAAMQQGTRKRNKQKEKRRAGNMAKLAWTNTKSKKHWETCQNMVSFSGATWSTMDKTSENGHFSRRIVFKKNFPWDFATFSAEGPNPNAQKSAF